MHKQQTQAPKDETVTKEIMTKISITGSKVNVNLEFDNLVKSCDSCHESYNKDAEVLNFTD